MRDLFKAILKTGSGSAATVLFGMIAIKLIASRMGAGALGSFSILKQFILAGSAMFITGGQTALVQGMSSRSGEERRKFRATALRLMCGGSLVVGGVTVLTAGLIGRWFLPQYSEQRSVMWIVGIAIALAGPVAFVFGSLNSERRIGRLAFAQTVNGLAMAMLAWTGPRFWRLEQSQWFALILAGSQLPGIVVGAVFLGREQWAGWRLGFDRTAARSFLNVGFATFLAASMQGWTVLSIRGSVAMHRGLTAAGIFDAGWTVSMVYVMLVLGSFSTYYLPTLASRGAEGGLLIADVLKTSLMIVVPLIAAMMAIRSLLIVVLYSAEFLPAVRMMHWMLIGDFLKVLSFVMAMPMIAFADTRPFLIGELGWNAAMVVGTQLVLRNGFNIEWLGAVFAISYLGYLAYSWSYCRMRMGNGFQRHLIAPIVSGSGVLLIVAAVTWKTTGVSPAGIVAAVAGSGIHLAMMYTRSGLRQLKRSLVSRPA